MGAKKKRILLVDDRCPLAETLAFYLRECDFDVILATDAKEAVRQLQRENFEALILDYRAQAKESAELFQQVKSGDPAIFPRLLLLASDSRIDPELVAFVVRLKALMAAPHDFHSIVEKLKA